VLPFDDFRVRIAELLDVAWILHVDPSEQLSDIDGVDSLHLLELLVAVESLTDGESQMEAPYIRTVQDVYSYYQSLDTTLPWADPNSPMGPR
jgi:acyl carrier protein